MNKSVQQPNSSILYYIKQNFIREDTTIKRKDGYIGYKSMGYRAFDIPAYVSGIHWSKGKYRVLAHQISFYLEYGRWPLYELDHFDFDRLNNDPNNLREVTGDKRKEQYDYSQKSRSKGYYLDKRYGNAYDCYIRKNRKQMHIGRAATEPEAIRKVALARINLLNDWEESFVDTRPPSLYVQRPVT